MADPPPPYRLDKWAEVPIPHLEPQEHLTRKSQLEEHLAKALRDSNRSLAALFEQELKGLSDTGYSRLISEANHAQGWRVFQMGGVPCAELERTSGNRIASLPFEVNPSIFGDGPDRRDCWRPTRTVRVNDGWLVASNRGEFGAWLDWFDGRGESSYKISNHQVVDFVEVAGNLLVIEGLAHMGMSRGSLVKLVRTANRWTVEKVAKLPSAPCVAIPQGESILIVHGEGLLRSTASGAMVDLVRFPSIGMLYPNSAILDGQKLYVGMRGFVWEVDLQHAEAKARLLAPNALCDT